MAYPSKKGGSKGGSKDGYMKSSKTGGAHVPGGQSWSACGANVKESRLNKGSDKQWRGKRG